MRNDVRPSAGVMAVVVFCMTVLVGIGGTSAYALWEQSSTVTMKVRAAVSNPEPTPTPTRSTEPAPLTLTCTTLDNSSVQIGIIGAGTPSSLSVSAKVTGGSYGQSFPLSPAADSVTLSTLSPVIQAAGAANRNVVIKITATSSDGMVAGGEYDHVKITADGAKLACSSGTHGGA